MQIINNVKMVLFLGFLFLFVRLRLKSFYQTEWDKVHQTYQEEADKFGMLKDQQVRGHTHKYTCLPFFSVRTFTDMMLSLTFTSTRGRFCNGTYCHFV